MAYSILRSIEYLKEYNIFDEHDYYAIANLCVEPNTNIIVRTLRYAHAALGPEKKIHVFGLKIKALRKVKNIIYSFDSMAWTRPVELGLHKKYPHSAKTVKQRELFFTKYIEHLKNEFNVKVE